MCILKYAINGNGFYTVHYIDFGMISVTGDNSAIMEGGDTITWVGRVWLCVGMVHFGEEKRGCDLVSQPLLLMG